MKRAVKQIPIIIVLIITFSFIIIGLDSLTTTGLLRMVNGGNIQMITSLIVVFYMLYKVYIEISKPKKDGRNITQLCSLIILAGLLLMNSLIITEKTTLMAIRFALLFRFISILGMIYVVEYYIVENVVIKYRLFFSVIMASFMVFLFIFILDMIPTLAIGYYFVALCYLWVIYFKWQSKKSRLDFVRHITIMLMSLGLINDIFMILYDVSIEMILLVVTLGIFIIYSTKIYNRYKYYQEKEKEIKSLNSKISKLNLKNKAIEASVSRTKNELSSRFKLKQNYYENLELIIDVLNTNVIVINQDFKVELSYGNAFHYDEIVGLEISKALFDVLNDDAQYFESVIKKVFDANDEVREQLFLSLLDQKLIIHNMDYLMSYYTMRKHNDEKVLIMHAELQDQHSYIGEKDQEHEIVEMVTAIVRNTEMFFSDLSSFIDFSKRITKYLNTSETLEDNIFRILRRVHTFKGVFDQYNMYTTVRGINDIENELFNTLHNLEELTLDQFSKVLIAYDLESILRTDMMILKQRLGEKFFNNKTKIHIDLMEFDRVYLNITDLLGQDHEISKSMETLKQVEIFEILESFREYVLRIADDQSKLVRFEITGEHVRVNRSVYIEFFEGLIHILKNSVTHGVEYPDERRTLGKDETATIRCDVKVLDGMVHLSISDDGHGIDIKEIKNRLFILGKYSIEELDVLSDEKICNMVIEDGVTSYLTPNAVAGRGVGMGSIKEVVREVGGSISVSSMPDKGVVYDIYIPVEGNEHIKPIDNQAIVNNLCLQAERLLTKSEKKSTLSSTWYKTSTVVDDSILLDVSSFIVARSFRDRRLFVSVDEAFLYQLIGSYGLHLKYKGSNLKVMNEAISMFVEDITNRTIDELKTEQQHIHLESACIMSNKMFAEICKGHIADIAELDITEGKLRIVILKNQQRIS